jgi:hypothetical protein
MSHEGVICQSSCSTLPAITRCQARRACRTERMWENYRGTGKHHQFVRSLTHVAQRLSKKRNAREGRRVKAGVSLGVWRPRIVSESHQFLPKPIGNERDLSVPVTLNMSSPAMVKLQHVVEVYQKQSLIRHGVLCPTSMFVRLGCQARSSWH